MVNYWTVKNKGLYNSTFYVAKPNNAQKATQERLLLISPVGMELFFNLPALLIQNEKEVNTDFFFYTLPLKSRELIGVIADSKVFIEFYGFYELWFIYE